MEDKELKDRLDKIEKNQVTITKVVREILSYQPLLLFLYLMVFILLMKACS